MNLRGRDRSPSVSRSSKDDFKLSLPRGNRVKTAARAVHHFAARSTYKSAYRLKQTGRSATRTIGRMAKKIHREWKQNQEAKKLKRKYQFRYRLLSAFMSKRIAHNIAFKGTFGKVIAAREKAQRMALRQRWKQQGAGAAIKQAARQKWTDTKYNAVRSVIGKRAAKYLVIDRPRRAETRSRNQISAVRQTQYRNDYFRKIDKKYDGKIRDVFQRHPNTWQYGKKENWALKQALSGELKSKRYEKAVLADAKFAGLIKENRRTKKPELTVKGKDVMARVDRHEAKMRFTPAPRPSSPRKPESATGLNSRMGQNGLKYGLDERGEWSRDRLKESMASKAGSEGRKRDLDKEVARREQWIREELVKRGIAKEVAPGRYQIDHDRYRKEVLGSLQDVKQAKKDELTARNASRERSDHEYKDRFIDKKNRTRDKAFTDAQMSTMRDIGRYQMMTFDQVQRLHYAKPSGGSYSDVAKKDIQALQQQGMVGHKDIITKSGSQRVYFLQNSKGRTINAIDSTHEKYFTGGWSKEAKQFEHDHLISEACHDLQAEMESRGWTLKKIYTEDHLKDFDRGGAAVGLQHGDDIPDAVLTFEKPNGDGTSREVNVAAEVDLGYDSKTIQSKQKTFSSRGLTTMWYSGSKSQTSRVASALAGKSGVGIKTWSKGVWK